MPAETLPRAAARVRLRRLQAADLDRFSAYRADPELARYQGWQAMSRDEALAFLVEMQAAPAFVAGEWSQLAIAAADDDRLLGDIGVCLGFDGWAEIGFTLARDAHGRGLATDAVQALIGLLFEDRRVVGVRGITDVRNTASARLLQRLGLQPVRTEATVFRGEPCEEVVYERVRPA